VTFRIGSSDQSLPITRDRSASKGGYAIRLERAEVEMTYSREDERTMIIEHTSVPDALRGRHVGDVLVRRSVEDARAEGRKIIPLCPFAKGQISRHPEWLDVLAHRPLTTAEDVLKRDEKG
jgi:uncharacterized protein